MIIFSEERSTRFKDLNNAFDAARGRIIFTGERGQLLFKDALDFAEDFGGGSVHGRDAPGDVALNFMRQALQDD